MEIARIVGTRAYLLAQAARFFSAPSDLGCIQTLLAYDAQYGLEVAADRSQFPEGIFLD
jgi:hypothetical protein